MNRFYYILVCLLITIPVALFANDPVLIDINDIPGTDQIRKPQPINIGEYTGNGFIDSVDNESLVLNDQFLLFSSGLTVKSLDGSSFSKKIEKGLYIYYFLDKDQKLIKIFVED